MTTLTGFLLARVSDDENRAQRFWDEWSREGGVIDVSRYVGPTQTLAECEAKRRIVEQHVENASRVAAYRSPRWLDGMNDSDIMNWRKAEAVCAATDSVVRALASVYADHPDYQAEWAIA